MEEEKNTEETLIINQPDFRRYATQEEKAPDGAPQFFCVCAQLLEGRREGFVSIRSRLQYLEDRKIINSRNNIKKVIELCGIAHNSVNNEGYINGKPDHNTENYKKAC